MSKRFQIVTTKAKAPSLRKRALGTLALGVAVAISGTVYGITDAQAQGVEGEPKQIFVTLADENLTTTPVNITESTTLALGSLTDNQTSSTKTVGGVVYQTVNDRTSFAPFAEPMNFKIHLGANAPGATAIITAGHDGNIAGNTITIATEGIGSNLGVIQLAGSVSSALTGVNGDAVTFLNNRVFIGVNGGNTILSTGGAGGANQYGSLINTAAAAGTSANSIDRAFIRIGLVHEAFASALTGGSIVNSADNNVGNKVDGNVTNSLVVIGLASSAATIASTSIIGGNITIVNSILGTGTGSVTDNTVHLETGGTGSSGATIVGGNIISSVVNNTGHTGSVANNTVTIDGGFKLSAGVVTVIGGGTGELANATLKNNAVTVGDGVAIFADTNSFVGAQADSAGALVFADATLTGNKVTISKQTSPFGGNKIQTIFGASVLSSRVKGQVSENTVTLTDVLFGNAVHLVAAVNVEATTGGGTIVTANDNQLTVNGATNFGTSDVNLTAVKLNVTDATSIVYASDNTISLSHDTVLVGTLSAVSTDATAATSEVKNNIVVLGTGTLAADDKNVAAYVGIDSVRAVSNLSGGDTTLPTLTANVSGNTLVTHAQINLGGATISGFDTLNLSTANYNGTDALLTTTGAFTATAAGTTITLVGGIGAGSIHILNAALTSSGNVTIAGGLTQSNSAFTTELNVDGAVDGVVDISTTAGQIIATAGRSFVNASGVSSFNSKLGSAMFANVQGADLVATRGMDSAAASAGSNPRSWVAFAALSGGTSSYDTGNGSNVDVDGVSTIVGLAKSIPVTTGDVVVGAFFETGFGDVENDFVGGTNGGDSEYYGGGLLVQYNHNSGFYGEGSFRAGESENTLDYQSGTTSFNNEGSSSYYGVSVGAGYKMPVSKAGKVDLYGRYSWGQSDGSNATLDTIVYNFDDVSSQRTELGARYHHAVSKSFTPYIGAAWQHEFDGDAEGTAGGIRVDSISLEGSTGIFEAGLNFHPSTSVPLTIDLNVTGYAGQREGVTGNLKVGYAF